MSKKKSTQRLEPPRISFDDNLDFKTTDFRGQEVQSPFPAQLGHRRCARTPGTTDGSSPQLPLGPPPRLAFYNRHAGPFQNSSIQRSRSANSCSRGMVAMSPGSRS